MQPLADKLRPKLLEEVVGQKHIIAPNKALYNMIVAKRIPSIILYGPPGCGKTSIANVIALSIDKDFHKINATTTSSTEIKEIVKNNSGNSFVLAIDEIQNFNKKQQQSLLEYMENGTITLIAMTTENPYFYVIDAIRSRSNIFELKPISTNDLIPVLRRGIDYLNKDFKINISIDDNASSAILQMANGDARVLLNTLELLTLSMYTGNDIFISIDDVANYCDKNVLKFDNDEHYNLMSAFQKSIRGSDPDAAVYYLARLLILGEMSTVCRRLLVIASEDIGLAYPQAASIVCGCVEAARQLGMPEARIPLSQATILLATAPKSNSACVAIDNAYAAIHKYGNLEIPKYLKDSHYEGARALGNGTGYLYPHIYPNHYVEQRYLPEKLDHNIYDYGENKIEQTTKSYWSKIKKAD